MRDRYHNNKLTGERTAVSNLSTQQIEFDLQFGYLTANPEVSEADIRMRLEIELLIRRLNLRENI